MEHDPVWSWKFFTTAHINEQDQYERWVDLTAQPLILMVPKNKPNFDYFFLPYSFAFQIQKSP